jgi:16S rRNA (cytidine1402-2'-O)-methyltransferase
VRRDKREIISIQRERSQQTPGPATTSAEQPHKAEIETGTLYIVAVPIGQPNDISLRALRMLGEADLIASEDPAVTQQLLSHHGLTTTVTSYGPTNLLEKVTVLIDRLKRGARIALVSDCGTPVIADPGALLVDEAQAHGIRVISVPGPSALTAAVAAAGFSGESFFFQGQLPEQKARISRCLADRVKSKTPTVAFCTNRSIRPALRSLAELAPQQLLVLVCDLTTGHEQIIRGTAGLILKRLDDLKRAQHITLILTGGKQAKTRRAGRKTN